MTLRQLTLATALGLGLALPSTFARADMCGGHPHVPIFCASATVGAFCNTAGSGSTDGTCQLPATDAGVADAGADGGTALECVASSTQADIVPHGLLAFLAPWLVALLFPALLRKPKKA